MPYNNFSSKKQMSPKISIGKEQAIQFYETEWWKDKSYREIAFYQLFTAELMCPFDVFHEAVEKSLGRPVFTHEFGLNYDGLCEEFLGYRSAPSLQDIINLIPEDKRVVV
jgi:hypothetical protein